MSSTTLLWSPFPHNNQTHLLLLWAPFEWLRMISDEFCRMGCVSECVQEEVTWFLKMRCSADINRKASGANVWTKAHTGWTCTQTHTYAQARRVGGELTAPIVCLQESNGGWFSEDQRGEWKMTK